MTNRVMPPNLIILSGMTNELANKIRMNGPVTTTMFSHSNGRMLHAKLEEAFPGEFTYEQIIE